MQRIRKPPAGRGRARFLTDDERRRLLVACRESSNACLYPIVVCAISTGGRKNELRFFRWPDVDFEQGVLRFVKTKTHTPRAVPLLGDARKLLEGLTQQRQVRVPWVFPRADGRQPPYIDYAWTEALKRADVQDFRFHDLRHTFASFCAMAGASLRDIAEVLGHRHIRHTMRYAHLLPSHVADQVERMAAAFLTTDSPQTGGHHEHA